MFRRSDLVKFTGEFRRSDPLELASEFDIN
jgi:hypothetical protein